MKRLSKNITKARVLKLSLFCWFTFQSSLAFGFDEKLDSQVRSAYFDVLNLDFESARKKLRASDPNPQKNPYRLYVANLADALEVFVTDDKKLYEQLEDAEVKRLSEIAKLPDTMPEKHFLDAEVRIHWAFVKFRFGYYVKSFFSLRKAYFSATTNRINFPGHLPTSKSLGVLHILLGSVPESYDWVLSLLGMKGDLNSGLNELKRVANSQSVFAVETKTFNSIFKAFLLNKETEAVEELSELLKKEDYISVKLVQSFTLIKTSYSKEAQQQLLYLKSKHLDKKIPFIHYLLAETYLQECNYPLSIGHYQRFVESCKGQNFLKDAYTKLAINYWLQNDAMYVEHLEKARATGVTNVDADKNASDMIANEELPNRILLKIRYATDGGFYEKAEKLLNSTSVDDFEREEERIEYHYRKARLHHKAGKLDVAILEYQTAIKRQRDIVLYFAPNCHLQLGYIYAAQKKYDLSLKHLESAKKYGRHPYKYSIDKKANIEIERISRVQGK